MWTITSALYSITTASDKATSEQTNTNLNAQNDTLQT